MATTEAHDAARGEWRLFVDGGARGNPGPAGAGAVVFDPHGRRRAGRSYPLGVMTNNAAEYEGLARGLALAREAGAQRLAVYSDSELMVRQLAGRYRIRAPHLAAAAGRVRELMEGFAAVRLDAVRREANREADRLANEAMDAVERETKEGTWKP